MPKSRSPVLGYNHNIRHKGWVFHVQTEDSGVQNPHIFTHLFHEGVIIASKKLSYDAEADDDIVKGLMQAQHKSVMKELKHGAFDAKIDAYLGPSAATSTPGAVPLQIEDEAGATVPNSPPEMMAAMVDEAAISSPYAQIELDDDTQSVVSGSIDLAPPPDVTDDSDDEINGLLNRLREETPVPEFIPPPAQHAEHGPGAWIVARPGQKERPFDKSGPIPVQIPGREDMARRIVTPPPVPVPVIPPPPPPEARRAPITGKPAAQAPIVPPRQRPPSVPPTRPAAPPSPPRGIAHQPTLPRAPRPPAPTPILPRGPAKPATPDSRMQPPAGRSQPMPPVLPRSQNVSGPLGAGRAPMRAATPPTGTHLPSSPSTRPMRPTPSEAVVVARPAVVIGAPSTIIGGPGDTTRRSHGRESSPGSPNESIFGQDLISEKSLDEVIMAYLSEESNED